MKAADGVVRFGEWLPDLPDYENPGLTEALNVLPTNRVYRSFATMKTSGTATGFRVRGALIATDPTTGSPYWYVGGTNTLMVAAENDSPGPWTTLNGAIANSLGGLYSWRFAQFDEFLIAGTSGHLPQVQTVGSVSVFTTLASIGTVNAAREVAVVNRFVVVGGFDLARARVQWSAIDDPRNWPTPGTSTAQSLQSGEQTLDMNYGDIMRIVDLGQYALIFQKRAITRMTYVGGNVVFQFETMDYEHGTMSPDSVVVIGRLAYFVDYSGFYVTDGVQTRAIGYGKVDNYFRRTLGEDNQPGGEYVYAQIYGAADKASKCIYWCYQTSGSSTANAAASDALIIYNYEEGRFTRATDSVEVLVGAEIQGTRRSFVRGFKAQVAGGYLDDTILTDTQSYNAAVIETAEIGYVAGGNAFLQGLAPVVTGMNTVTGLNVAVRYRSDLSSTPALTDTGTSSPTTRLPFVNFRREARYHSARITINGRFEAAIGLQYQVKKGSPV